MRKKSFKQGFDLILGESEALDEPKKSDKDLKAKTEVRATFVLNKQNLDDLKSIAYWERKKIKDVLKEALVMYINKYIDEKGKIEVLEKIPE